MIAPMEGESEVMIFLSGVDVRDRQKLSGMRVILNCAVPHWMVVVRLLEQV